MLTKRRTLVEDLYEVAELMRPDDEREVATIANHTPLQALMAGFKNSEVCETVVDHNDDPIAIFGVTRTSPLSGAAWMLATTDLDKNYIQFIRKGRGVIDELNASYPVLHNFVDSRNTVHLRWLKRMGFVFIRTVEYGTYRVPFYEFVRINKQCVA